MVLSEKGILKQFNLVIYPIDFVVVIGDLEEGVNEEYAPNEPEASWIGKPGKDTAGRTYNVHCKEDNQQCVMIWFPSLEQCTGPIICHEVGHVALEIFDYIGATINPEEDQECFCYLLGTLFRMTNGTCSELKEYKSKSKKK